MRLQPKSHRNAFVLDKESRACSGPLTTSTPIPTSTLLGPDLGSLDSQRVRVSGSRFRTGPWSVLVSEPKQTRIPNMVQGLFIGERACALWNCQSVSRHLQYAIGTEVSGHRGCPFVEPYKGRVIVMIRRPSTCIPASI